MGQYKPKVSLIKTKQSQSTTAAGSKGLKMRVKNKFEQQWIKDRCNLFSEHRHGSQESDISDDQHAKSKAKKAMKQIFMDGLPVDDRNTKLTPELKSALKARMLKLQKMVSGDRTSFSVNKTPSKVPSMTISKVLSGSTKPSQDYGAFSSQSHRMSN